jgi:hypothetical protein
MSLNDRVRATNEYKLIKNHINAKGIKAPYDKVPIQDGTDVDVYSNQELTALYIKTIMLEAIKNGHSSNVVVIAHPQSGKTTAEEKKIRKEKSKKIYSEISEKRKEISNLRERKPEIIQGPKGGKRAKKYNLTNLSQLLADGESAKFYSIEESANSEIDNILRNFDKIDMLKEKYEEFKKEYKSTFLNDNYSYNGAHMKDSQVRSMLAINYYFNGGTDV